MPDAGTHLCHAMLLPKPEALDAARRIQSSAARSISAPRAVERQGKAAVVIVQQSALPQRRGRDDAAAETETAVDLAMLDPTARSACCAATPSTIRNTPASACSATGINLTHIYHGKIPYLWYVTREMGFVNKMMRGLARPDASPDEIYGGTIEKPWVARRRALRDRRRLPVSAGDGLRGGGERRLHDAAGAQGRHHPGRRQHAACRASSATASRARRSCRAAARLRHAGRPHDLRRDRAARRDGCGARRA